MAQGMINMSHACMFSPPLHPQVLETAWSDGGGYDGILGFSNGAAAAFLVAVWASQETVSLTDICRRWYHHGMMHHTRHAWHDAHSHPSARMCLMPISPCRNPPPPAAGQAPVPWAALLDAGWGVPT